MKKILLLILGLMACRIFPQAEETLQWYDLASKAAINRENYETAVRILQEGIRNYPHSFQLNLRLADLYYNKELYSLALKEYLATDGKSPNDFHVLNRIQRCFGYLNKNRDAVNTLERIVSLFPDKEESAVDLGWMYFKTHQLEKGEGLLLKSIDRFGFTRSLSMTLGTIYSDMYDYEKSREYYLRSIQDALVDGDSTFAAVAYYNLSLLEQEYYHYNSAFRYTQDSLEQEDRATGHLSKGDLFQSQLDFRGAYREYQKGIAMDDSPLTKVNMAILYQKFGLLEAARSYAEELLRMKDLSWMHYFGTDRDLHMKDLHKLLADIYEGLTHTILQSPSRNIIESLKSFFVSLGNRLKAEWNRRKFREFSIRVGKDYLAKENYLNAYWEFFKANEPYRDVALKYLHRARDIETRVKPRAAAYYLQEEGKLTASVRLLEESVSRFDPYWEKDAMADSLIGMARLMKRGSPERRAVLNRLYRLNPGTLRQSGFGLPIEITLDLPPALRGARNILMRMLSQSGFDIRPASLGRPASSGDGFRSAEGFEYALAVTVDSRARFRLTGFSGGAGSSDTAAQGSVPVGQDGLKNLCFRLVSSILEEVYRVR